MRIRLILSLGPAIHINMIAQTLVITLLILAHPVPSPLPNSPPPPTLNLATHPLRLLRRPPLRIHLQDRRPGDVILIARARRAQTQHHVHLSRDPRRERVDLVVFVAARDAHLDGVYLQAGVEDGEDGGVGFDLEAGCGGGGVGGGEGDGGAAGSEGR